MIRFPGERTDWLKVAAWLFVIGFCVVVWAVVLTVVGVLQP